MSALNAKAPRTFAELLALKPDELEGTDIALMNLLCAEGLPGAEKLNVNECLAALDKWAQHAKREIDRNYHHFREDPAHYYHSEAFYRMLMLAVVVYEDFGIRYNPKWIAPPSEVRSDDHFFADSRDILIHGMVGPQRMGTCSSMPVFYIALGRRLGYPLKLVTTKQHLFMRWDSPSERFNMDATGKGLDKYDDEYYKRWPFPITDQEIKEQDHLKSLSSREELSVFLAIRGACLTEAGRLSEATAVFDAAYRHAPNWIGNQVMLAGAQRRQQGLPTAQMVLLRQDMNRTRPVNPLEPDPMRQMQNPWNHAQAPSPNFPPDPNPLSQISKSNENPMKSMKRKITLASALFVALWTTQTALAWYDPSTGRWLTRDPIGEPGFQALQQVRAIPQASGVAPTSGRWIHRVRPDNENRYLFVGNNPVNHIDPLGLLTFAGCSSDQQQRIQNQWNSFCQQAKSSSFKCCLNHFNIPQRLAAMCDRADTKIVCDPSETSGCGWTYPLGRTIYLSQLGLSEDPGCGPIGCTLLHEMTHLAGHWTEKWADRVENCLQGCPKRPAH